MNERFALAAESRLPFAGPEGLWTKRDLLRLWVPALLGLAGLLFAWYRSASESDWRDDTFPIVIAVASLGLAGAGALVWLIRGSARLSASRRIVRAALIGRFGRDAGQVPSGEALYELRVTSPRMRRYHRPDCLLMVGKDPVALNGDRGALRSCEVCDS